MLQHFENVDRVLILEISLFARHAKETFKPIIRCRFERYDNNNYETSLPRVRTLEKVRHAIKYNY